MDDVIDQRLLDVGQRGGFVGSIRDHVVTIGGEPSGVND